MYGTRHKFIVIALLVAASGANPIIAQAPLILRVGVVTRVNPAGSAASVTRGVELGAAEARQTASLFGGDVLLFEERADPDAEAAAARLLAQRKVQVLLASADADADALSRFADQHRLIFLNAASRSSTLRASCRRYTFHVEASDSMYATAVRRDVSRTSDARDSTALWTGSLQKYGASQINDRFRNKYRSPMDGSAWAGWVAVKIAAEAALRSRSTRPAAMLAHLESPSTSFDGHKGWPLSFRREDHQLRQPLYVVVRPTPGAAATITDVPPLSALAAGVSANAKKLLDSLMPQSSPCAWSHR